MDVIGYSGDYQKLQTGAPAHYIMAAEFRDYVMCKMAGCWYVVSPPTLWWVGIHDFWDRGAEFPESAGFGVRGKFGTGGIKGGPRGWIKHYEEEVFKLNPKFVFKTGHIR